MSGAAGALWLLLAMTLIVPPAMFVVSAWITWNEHFAAARYGMERTLDLVHEHATKVFETHELVAGQVNQILSGLSDEEIREREPEFHRQLAAVVERLPQINDIWVVNEAGRPLVTAAFLPVDRNLDLSDRGYWRAFAEGHVPPDGVYVSEVLRGRQDPNARFFQFTLARPATPAGDFTGVLAISVEPDYFDGFYAEAAAGAYDSITMTRTQGDILGRFPPLSDRRNAHPPESAFLREIRRQPDRGSYEAPSSFEGVQRLTVYRKIADRPVYLSVGLDRARVVSQWWSDITAYLYFGLPATVALVGVTVLAIARTRRERLALETLRQEILRREMAEEQYRQAQKMEAVGRLTGGIAHDFNNLLQISMGNLELLWRRTTADRVDERRFVAAAMDGMRRASTLTRRLLAFARRQPLDPQVTDINRLVSDTSDMLSRILGETVQVDTVLAEGLWSARVDPNELETAILNLAVNARDAMQESGRLTIETSNAVLDEAYASKHADVRAGPYVLVAVTDTGHGIADDVIDKVFEPFFTTKPAGEGTGLGLSQVYGFARQSGGHVTIDSTPGRGTTVGLYVPQHVGAPTSPRRAMDISAVPTARPDEAILVVEDEAEVRNFAREALRDLGYQVLEADTPDHALSLLAAHPYVALLLTDIVMPGMTGKQLADAAAARQPGLRVLYMTGYTRDTVVHDGVLDEGVNLLTKPFSLEQLARKVRGVLDQAPATAGPEMGRAIPEPQAGGLAPAGDAAPPRVETDHGVASTGSPHTQKEAGVTDRVNRGTTRVLCVEDEPILAMATEDMLDEIGCAATVVGTAEDALDRLRAGHDFDLVLTDQSLPGLSGTDLVAKMREMQLNLPVVLATGHRMPDGVSDHALFYLGKPYGVRELRAVVEEACGSQNS